ncbi:MAG: cytidine deaminase [Actinomycetia bacterium]|nr:cytidine deaminase [Actinomycetes bacterium]
MPQNASPDWDALRSRARGMTERSYAPYSGVRVGAAALTSDGEVVTGCNVENASTGIGICAEVTLATSMVAHGSGQKLVAMAVVAGDGDPIPPCGRCRQFLYEFGGDAMLIETAEGIVTLGELLPGAFGPGDVAGRSG